MCMLWASKTEGFVDLCLALGTKSHLVVAALLKNLANERKVFIMSFAPFFCQVDILTVSIQNLLPCLLAV